MCGEKIMKHDHSFVFFVLAGNLMMARCFFQVLLDVPFHPRKHKKRKKVRRIVVEIVIYFVI